jgi:hypothetical protein
MPQMLTRGLRDNTPRAPDQRLFVSRYGEPLSATGLRFKLAAYVKAAAEIMPTLRAKHVTSEVEAATTPSCSDSAMGVGGVNGSEHVDPAHRG